VADSKPVDTSRSAAAGGSARSEASAIHSRRWKPRRTLAFGIHAAVILVPLAGATVAVEIATHFVRRPATLGPFVVWLLALMALATLALRLVDRQIRRLLPLATMLRLSLVFPDHAPSRFSIALKTGSGRALERAVGNADAQHAFATPQETAEAVVSLLGTVSRHDRLTRGHCERVRAYSDLIGQQLRLDPESAARLHWAALLHDVGKLDVPAEILNKKGKLTPEEWEQVRRHPGASDKWLVGLRPWLGDWSRAASEHHERFDGAGYPHGLAGEEISLAGRIVAVADAFDVMTAARSYKKPFPAAQARVELTDNAGTQFDPEIVRAFLAISLGDLRRVLGPIAWLATVPELVRLGVTGALVPARTAVTAASLAAVSLVPIVVTPAHVAAPLDAAFAASAPTGTGAGPTTTTPQHRSGGSNVGAESHAQAREATTSGPAAVPTTSTAPRETTTTVPLDTAVPPTTPSGRGGSGSNSGPGGGGGSTSTTTRPASTTTTTKPPASTTTTTQPAHAPVANNDNPAAIVVNTHVQINVLGNDTDVDGNLDPSTVKIVSLSAAAKLQQITVTPAGKIDFFPTQLYVGPTSLVYEVCDTTHLCSTAKLTLTIVAL
jgi:hypothetical protein